MIRRPALFLVGVLLVLPGCADSSTQESSTTASSRAQAILDSARAAAGADVLSSGARVSFNFRGDRFRLKRGDGTFSYARSFRDSLGRRVEDVLTGDTLRRRVDGQPAPLSPDQYRQVETTVNSVAYFALLPFPLGDPAVQPRYVGPDTVRGTPYYQVAVTFRKAGGGRDWQDRFLYWFDQRDYSMDYLAYAFGLGESEDVGTRFREAFNERRIGGVRFADYRNYTADSLAPHALARYGHLLEADSLRLVSTVALDSVQVKPLR